MMYIVYNVYIVQRSYTTNHSTETLLLDITNYETIQIKYYIYVILILLDESVTSNKWPFTRYKNKIYWYL